jgi:hypothetical protein
MISELERIWKDAVVASFKVLFPHSPGGLRKIIKTSVRRFEPGVSGIRNRSVHH